MPRITDAQEARVREIFTRTNSIREAAQESGHSRDTVRRVVSAPGAAILGGSGPADVPAGIDYERLASMVAARLGGRLPVVDEGPPAPQEYRQARAPGIIDAPRLHGRIAWLSDVHVPYHDAAAVDAALAMLGDWKPDLVIVGGDLFDSYLISSYDKEPERLNATLQDEFDAGKPITKRINDLNCEVVFILGNHEARINALVGKNPGLARMRALEWTRMAELPASWRVLPQHSRYRVGSLDFHHGDIKTGPGGRYVAARMLEDLKRSSVFGHFHRDQFYPEPDGDGVIRGGFASGHLCDVAEAAKYCKINRWTTGFRTVDMDPATGLFEVRSHLIHGGKLRFDGRTYAG